MQAAATNLNRSDITGGAEDEAFMRRALELAQQTVGMASPNPQVGCVLVCRGNVIGEGAHLYDAFDHAEIVALKQCRAAGHDSQGATAYVTLEPCSHTGRTGPCADAFLAAGITRCVVATADPNPAVGGKGIRRLQAAGVEVVVGVLEREARQLNDAFAFAIVHGRPFVTLKAALSVEGYLAPPPTQRTAAEPFWLTSTSAREEVQQMRYASDAVLTGIGTVLADDPLLTDRTGQPRRRPLQRIVLDTHLRLPLSTKLVQTSSDDLWVFCGNAADVEAEAPLLDQGVRVTRVASRGHGLDLAQVLQHLHRARLLSVLLESGSALNGAFLHADLVDRIRLFYAEHELGAGSVPFAAGTDGPFALELRCSRLEKRLIGPDILVSGYLHDPWQ